MPIETEQIPKKWLVHEWRSHMRYVSLADVVESQSALSLEYFLTQSISYYHPLSWWRWPTGLEMRIGAMAASLASERGEEAAAPAPVPRRERSLVHAAVHRYAKTSRHQEKLVGGVFEMSANVADELNRHNGLPVHLSGLVDWAFDDYTWFKIVCERKDTRSVFALFARDLIRLAAVVPPTSALTSTSSTSTAAHTSSSSGAKVGVPGVADDPLRDTYAILTGLFIKFHLIPPAYISTSATDLNMWKSLFFPESASPSSSSSSSSTSDPWHAVRFAFRRESVVCLLLLQCWRGCVLSFMERNMVLQSTSPLHSPPLLSGSDPFEGAFRSALKIVKHTDDVREATSAPAILRWYGECCIALVRHIAQLSNLTVIPSEIESIVSAGGSATTITPSTSSSSVPLSTVYQMVAATSRKTLDVIERLVPI